MTPEPFKFLPSEIIINILSKLPPRTILICKCVCKSWHHLVESQEFVKLHLANSAPGLVTFHMCKDFRSLKFFEIEDENDVEHHDLPYNLVTSFNVAGLGCLYGSVDGLLWLYHRIFTKEADAISIRNPITRDYIMIPTVPKFSDDKSSTVNYGFGSCRMSGQYKVVKISLGSIYDKESGYEQVEWHVYTLGSGSGWRIVAPSDISWVTPSFPEEGVFVNGNLHWLRGDINGYLHISCFDLETEKVSTVAVAPPLYAVQNSDMVELFAWGENLCLHDNTNGDDIVIWVMEEYGIAKSWTIKLVINRKTSGLYYPYKLIPLKVFKDGDILMRVDDHKLFNLSNKTKKFQQIDMFKTDNLIYSPRYESIIGVIHTPSFRSLKSFGMENVMSY